MGQPQSGILPAGNGHALFITLLLAPTDSAGQAARETSATVPGLTDELAGDYPEAALTSVIGFGSNAWDRLFPDRRPAQLRRFTEVDGQGGRAPATPGDIFLHIRSERPDLNFELARRIMQRFGDSVTVVEEIAAFRYLDCRDLTGFVDGTENPTGEARAAVALVGGSDPAFTDGSYIALQRYIHDLAAWERLPVAEQEQIIARTKADNIEFSGDDKPPTAHIKRVSIKEDGKSLEILRHSMPYGTTSEHGLYFVAYCATPDNFDKMLSRMLVADKEGHYDHLMNYSRAVTGAAFFAPARDWLGSASG